MRKYIWIGATALFVIYINEISRAILWLSKLSKIEMLALILPILFLLFFTRKFYIDTKDKALEIARKKANENNQRQAFTVSITTPEPQKSKNTKPKFRAFLPPASKPLKEYIVFDFETTGLDRSNDEVIQIGAVHCLNGEEVAEFEVLIKPNHPISEKITNITGITNKQLKRDGIDSSLAFEQFSKFVGALPLMAYNAPFDFPFLDRYFSDLNIEYNKKPYCILKLARKIWPEFKSHKLQSVIKELGSNATQSHTALSDSKLAHHVYLSAINPPDTNNNSSEVIDPLDVNPIIDINDKVFAFSGTFDFGTKADCQKALEAAGGIFSNGVTQKVNYLVVANNASTDWKYGSYGLKIEKAMDIRDNKKKKLAIITEDQLFDKIGQYSN